jgi:hypothetical protein
MMSRFFMMALILMPLMVFATHKGAGEDAASRGPTVQFTVVYGEKTTYFEIYKTKTGGVVEFYNNQGDHRSKILDSSDYDFFIAKAKAFAGPSDRLESCQREHIQVTDKSRKTIACLHGTTKQARDVRETTNSLARMF